MIQACDDYISAKTWSKRVHLFPQVLDCTTKQSQQFDFGLRRHHSSAPKIFKNITECVVMEPHLRLPVLTGSRTLLTVKHK